MALLPEVFVSFAFNGLENGSPAAPYDSVHEALVHVQPAGVVRLAPGAASSPVTITQPVTLTAQSGLVRIGST
jgi:hypothetical protein